MLSETLLEELEFDESLSEDVSKLEDQIPESLNTDFVYDCVWATSTKIKLIHLPRDLRISNCGLVNPVSVVPARES